MSESGNIGRWLERHASFTPDKTAIAFADRSISYVALDRWASGLAAALATDHGIGRGDRVAWLGLNRPETIALLFACARLGAILVPLNWRLAEAELAFIVEDCAPGVIACDETFGDTARAIAGARPMVSGDGLSDVLPDTPATQWPGTISDPLLVVYTSGTTGRPKGTVLDQYALLFNALNSLDMHAMTSHDRVLVVLPLFHVGGLNIQLTPALYCGATVHLHERFDPAATLTAIETARPDLLVLVPATMDALRHQPRWTDADLSSLRMLTTGSSVVPLELIQCFEDRGVSVIQVYGSTETCPIAAYQRPGEGRTLPLSTGRVALHSEVRLVDRDGHPVEGAGRDGEIQVRGPHVMRGYWNRPEETAAVLKDGWFSTGDIGRFDAAGNLYFQDRLKRMIISGGENIYAAEIERVLHTIDGIQEACVVGRADEHWGEVPVAAIVPRAGMALSEDAIRQVLGRELARFKHPKAYHFVAELPRNAMGKVIADEVRSMIESAD
jgi:fatty-acyl-CoA synthase